MVRIDHQARPTGRSFLRRDFSAAILAMTIGVSAAYSADPSVEMVAKLRERGWFDTAAQYVDWAEKSPLTTTQSRARLPYERALAQAEQAKQTTNFRTRSQLLAEAAAGFAAYAEKANDPLLAVESLRQAANLSAERGLTLRNSAEQLSASANRERPTQLAAARDSFNKARKYAKRLAALSTELLADMPRPAMLHADPAARQRLETLRTRSAEAAFLEPLIEFELAATYPDSSAERKAALNQALALFDSVREQYGESLLEVTCEFYVGRCLQLLGDLEPAIESYEKIVGKPVAHEQFRRWTARAHRRRAECLMQLSRIDEAIRGCEQWLQSSETAERNRPEWLALSFRLAEAYLAKVDGESQSSTDNRRLTTQARQLMREVAAERGEFQQEAKISLASFRQSTSEQREFDTFDEAFAAAKSALEVSNASKLAARLAQENNPAAVDELNQRAAASRQEAIELTRQALSLAGEDTLDVQIQEARYYLSFLYWEDGQYQQAAETSEQIAAESAASEFARSAAKVSLNAYEKLYRQARANGDGDQEREKLREVAELIAKRWPDSEEAAAAIGLQIGLALQESDIVAAEELLTRLPPSGRAVGELSLGAALWTEYLTSANQPQSDAAEAMRRAGEKLAAGYQGVRDVGPATVSNVTAVLYYAQYLLRQGEVDSAIEVLNNPQIGPLALADQGGLSDRPELLIEAYKTGLRAYLAATPPNTEAIPSAIAGLERAASQSSQPQALTGVYVSLGLQIEQRIEDLQALGQAEQASNLARTFQNVVERMFRRPSAGDWSVQLWLARTNLKLGQGLTSEESAALITRAEQGFKSILERAESDSSFAPGESAILGVQKLLADCQAAQGKYGDAVNEYVRILRQKPKLLDLQVSTADALQKWGVEGKIVKALDQSIRGAIAQADGGNLVWGWVRIAKVVEAAKRRAAASGSADANETVARYNELFFQARYQAALARYQSAQLTKGAGRQNHLRTVQQSIASMSTLYPDLGGPRWKPKFDKLRAQAEQELQR